MKTEKNIKKLGNLLIRQPSAKRKQTPIQKRVSYTGQSKVKKSEAKLDINREMIEAENLNQEEIKAISREASRMVNRKVKAMQNKVECGLVEMLQTECGKLGMELQKQRANNFALTNQNIQLRRSLELANKRLNDNNRQNHQLIQQNDNADIKVQQAKDEIQRVKLIMKRREDQLLGKLTAADLRYQKTFKELQQKKIQLEDSINSVSSYKTQIQELIEELEHYRGEGQKMKQTSDHKMRQFNKMRQQIQAKHKQQIQKKNQKIIRFQMQAQKFQQKLRQQQNVRKKISEKGKELQKQVYKKGQTIRELSTEVAMNKKRINDLNILKSSNKTILDQKITKLMDENQRLKKQLLKSKKSKTSRQSEQDVSCRPEMFDQQ